MDKKNAKARTTGWLLTNGMVLVIVAFALTAVAISALVGGFLAGKPPTSEHDAKLPVYKSESVTVETKPNGEAKSVKDTVYITNNPEDETLVDKSILRGVYNKKQKANEPKKTEDGDLKWKTGGNDVSYVGRAKTEDLPITMTISYYLNGEPIDAADTIGKSGVLRIDVEYHNNIKATLDDGKEIVVPYIAATSVLNGQDYSDVVVSTGRSIAISGQGFSVGVNLPGFKDLSGSSLFGIAGNKVSFTGKAKNFQGAKIYSMVTSELIGKINPQMIAKYNIDKQFLQADNKINKGMSMINKFLPYLDDIGKKVATIMQQSSKARETSSAIAEKLIKYINNLKGKHLVLDGVYETNSGILGNLVKELTGDTSGTGDTGDGQTEDGEASTNGGVAGDMGEVEEFLAGDEEDADDKGLIGELGQTVETLEKEKNEAEAAKEAAEAAGETDKTQQYEEQIAGLDGRIDSLIGEIQQMDPDSEYLPEDKRVTDAKGLIDKQAEAKKKIEDVKNIYTDPTYVEQYFIGREAELKSIIDSTTASKKDLEKAKKELEQLNDFKALCTDKDGNLMALQQLDKKGVKSSELASYLLDRALDEKTKSSLISRIRNIDKKVGKVDAAVQKYGSMVPGYIKKIENIKKKIDSSYALYKKFRKKYNDEFKGTLTAMQQTLEAYQKVKNFSGLSDGWKGETTYIFKSSTTSGSYVMKELEEGGKQYGSTLKKEITGEK